MNFLLKYPSVFRWNLFYIITNVTLLNVVINFILTESRHYLPMWIMFMYISFKDSHGIITKYLIKYYTYGKYMIFESIIHLINIALLLIYIKYKYSELLYIVLIMQIITIMNFKIGSKLVYKMIEKEGFVLSDYTISVENIYSISLVIIGLIMTFVTYKFETYIEIISIVMYCLVFSSLLLVLGKYFKLDKRYKVMKYKRKISYL